MYRYHQFCPIAKAAEVLGDRWTLLLLRDLMLGNTRFNQLLRASPRISPTTLSKRLAELQGHGLVLRRRIPGHDGYEYQVAAAGRELFPLLVSLGEWGMRWARGQMEDSELDVSMLMEDIRRRIDTRRLPGGRTVLLFRFTDLDRYAHWWVKIDGEEVELCLDDPGYEVDVWLTTDLRTLTEVWMGDRSLREARASGALKVVGAKAHLGNLGEWLPLHVLAGVRPARERPGPP